MKTAFALSFAALAALAALATVAGCAANPGATTTDSNSSDVVGVTDLAEMEAALGLEHDVKVNGQWTRGDDKLKSGACYKARFASPGHDPSHWEFRRYTNGAAFFRKLGAGPLEGDERAIRCVDIDIDTSMGTEHGDGTYETESLENLSLDLAVRMRLGKLTGYDAAAGSLFLGFEKQAIQIVDGEHLCGVYDTEGEGASIDPAMRAGAEVLASCGDSQACITRSYEACKAAFNADVANEGSIDRPALTDGTRVLGLTGERMNASVLEFVYRYATKSNTDALRFSMAADPVGAYQSFWQNGVEDITVYDKAEVHHIVLSGHLEALYLTAVTEKGDPAAHAWAKCERNLDANGEPTTAYACTGL